MWMDSRAGSRIIFGKGLISLRCDGSGGGGRGLNSPNCCATLLMCDIKRKYQFVHHTMSNYGV